MQQQQLQPFKTHFSMPSPSRPQPPQNQSSPSTPVAQAMKGKQRPQLVVGFQLIQVQFSMIMLQTKHRLNA